MKLFAFLSFLCVASIATAEPAMTIHEWGTFTSLQDEAGKSVGWLNVEDEPLPKFTHQLEFEFVGDAGTQRMQRRMQGYTSAHTDVTMRLETPVVYFHPAPGAAIPAMDVRVDFLGGYLTQFYPDAMSEKMDHAITAHTRSHLEWPVLQVGRDKPLPATTSHVWTAPRNVDAANVTNAAGETERFLFYRGVAHLDAPLRLVHESSIVEIHSQLDSAAFKGTPLKITKLWFCEFQEGDRCIFRELDPVTATADSRKVLASTPLGFEAQKATAENLGELTRSMRAALVADGLNGDEADALLSTWDLSYFKSPGTRLFFLVPRAWTDHYLPLQATPKAPLNRVMVGRIDLVTPEHRRLLRQIAQAPAAQRNDDAVWALYDHLGRFRNALLLDEIARRPSESLDAFIKAFDLQAARP